MTTKPSKTTRQARVEVCPQPDSAGLPKDGLRSPQPAAAPNAREPQRRRRRRPPVSVPFYGH